VLLEEAQRRKGRAVRERGETDHTHVDADDAGGLRHRGGNPALGLDRVNHLPTFRLTVSLHTFPSNSCENRGRIQPSLGRKMHPIRLIECERLRVGVAGAVALAGFLNFGKAARLTEKFA
jgi:hypothetical protein